MSAAWRAACVYAALTLLLAFPLSVHPAGTVASDAPDTDLYIWTLAWDTHALVTSPRSLFDANIFYPRRDTLAYSENLLGDLPIAAPVIWLTGNPLLAMNIVALTSAVLCGLGAFVLGRRVGLSGSAAFAAGLVYGFAPSRFLRLDQIHLATVEWIPFALAYLIGYLDTGRRRDLHLAIAFYVLQALTSGHGAVFATVAVAVMLLWRVASGDAVDARRRLRDAGVFGIVMLAALAALAVPYLIAQHDVGLKRTLENWSVPAASFLASPTHVDASLLALFSAQWINDSAAAYLFPGFLPVLLALLACVPHRLRRSSPRPARARSLRTVTAVVLESVAALAILVGVLVLIHGPVRWRSPVGLISMRTSDRAWVVAAVCGLFRWALRVRGIRILAALRIRIERTLVWARAHRRDPRPLFGLLALVTLWLSAGPPIGLWPAVYWLPGMNFIRAPSRFMILFVLALAVLAGVGVDRLAGAGSAARRRAVGTLCAALMVVEFSAFPFGASPLDIQPAPIDRWLATQPTPFSIVELPLPDPADVGPFARRQATFMLDSMAHWQKLVNGYSGITPPEHQALYGELSKFPTAPGIDALKALGVTYVVIHSDLYDPADWTRVERALGACPGLRLVHVEGAGRAYRVTR